MSQPSRAYLIISPIHSIYYTLPPFFPSEIGTLSPYRAGSAPALAGEVHRTGWWRRGRRVVVLVHSRDEVVWGLCFRVQRVGEEERDVLAEGGVCQEWRAAAGHREGDGCGCLGRHFGFVR